MHYNSDGTPITSRSGGPLHYHGSTVRALLITSAIVLLIGATTGSDLPLSGSGSVISAIVLMVVAGITNPEQEWIHWVNEFLTVLLTIVFGTNAIEYYHRGGSVLDHSFFFTEVLSIIFLVTLYFTTKTVRGFHLRKSLA
ncbi:MAG TPA: hypothetical protein VM103_02265 [Candidatus Paceibacterota bacterium]|nr:hypothetical protein [Candidatus Paceibacterota bacterium]